MNGDRIPAQRCPEVCVTQGNVGIFLGGGYRILTPANTEELVKRLQDALASLTNGVVRSHAVRFVGCPPNACGGSSVESE
jgi:hypothetical protein